MTMKKILFALLTGWMAISFTACDDFLTETPSTSVPTEEALVTTQDFQNALNGVYYTLGSYRFLGRDVLAIGDAPTVSLHIPLQRPISMTSSAIRYWILIHT